MATRIILALLFLTTGFFLPVSSVIAGSRNEVPNEFDLELAGKCLLYSFSYQRMIVEPFGLELGLSMLGGGSSSSSTSIFFYTVGGKVYFIQKNASPYIGAGYVGVSASTSSGPFSDSGSTGYGYVSPGFEFRSEGGFLMRGGVYVLMASGGTFVWPGLTIGVAF